MKRCSKPLAIKNANKNHYKLPLHTHTTMAVIKKTITRFSKDVGNWFPHTLAGLNVKQNGHFETVWHFPIRINIALSYDTAVLFLSIDSRESKLYIHTKFFT